MSLFTKICSNIWSRSWTKCHTQLAVTQRSFHLLNSATSKLPVNTLPAGLENGALATTVLQNVNRFLAPINSVITQVAGFKVKGRLKRRCKDCYFVIRHERHYVICPTHPRHKQMSMKKREYKSWILTHATQSKERGF